MNHEYRTTLRGVQMRKSSVVFELTDGEIRAFCFDVLPFSKSGHSSTVVRFDRIPISTGVFEQGNIRDENALIKILSKYQLENPSKNQRVYLAIPLQQGFLRSYTLPWFPKRDRKSAISLLVDEEISIARSDLLYDFLVISEVEQVSIQVLLGATRQSLLERYVFVFGQAGFKVTGVDFSFSVLGQALGFQPYEDVLYLQGELDSFQMTLFRGAVPEIIRTFPVQSTTNEGWEITKRQIGAWGNEIRRFLLYYRTQHTDLNLKRLVWNGDPIAEQLAQVLLESNQVSSIEKAKLLRVPDGWREVIKKNNGSCTVAVSYGLCITARPPKLNLWRQPNEIQTVEQRYKGIAIFAVALLMIGTMTWVALFLAASPLQHEVQQLSNKGARIVAEVKQQKVLEDAWKKVSINNEKIGTGLIQVQAMSSTELTIEQVSYRQGNLSMSGSAKGPDSVQTLIRTLRTLGWEHPALSGYKLMSFNYVEFSIIAKHGQVGPNLNTTDDKSVSFDERG